MSVSIYYTASRFAPLLPKEVERIKAAIAPYSVNGRIEEYLRTGRGLNWESFQYRLNTEDKDIQPKNTIFCGSTKLPDNTSKAMWEGVQHWCECLSAIRREVQDAEWEVRVEDHSIKWNVARNAYDPQS